MAPSNPGQTAAALPLPAFAATFAASFCTIFAVTFFSFLARAGLSPAATAFVAIAFDTFRAAFCAAPLSGDGAPANAMVVANALAAVSEIWGLWPLGVVPACTCHSVCRSQLNLYL